MLSGGQTLYPHIPDPLPSLVSFCDRLVGSLPKRTFTVLSGSWKSSLPSSTFFLPLLT
jgi:hypothetical protein